MTSGPEPTEATLPGIEGVLDRLAQRTGLELVGERRADAGRAFAQSMHDHGATETLAHERFLARTPGADAELVARLTVGETFFFRDRAQFDWIEQDFLPAMIEERPDDHRLRVWSAGCATGEEVWSLAMLFAEQGLADRSTIVGSDLSHRALDAARAASYRPWSFRGHAATRTREWVTERDGRFEVSPKLRSMVRFAPLNLAAEFPSAFNGFDLILCRNVLIYFDRETIRGVASRLYDALSPGGWLVLGASDPAITGFADFDVVETSAGLLLRRPLSEGATSPAPASPIDSAPLRIPSRWPSIPTDIAEVLDSIEHPIPIERHRTPAPPTDVEVVVDRVPTRAVETSGDPAFAIDRIRGLAAQDAVAALEAASEAARSHGVSVELHYLEAVLLVSNGRLHEAAEAVRRALFLDRQLVAGHMLLGTIRGRTGEEAASRRAFANAARLCRERPIDEIVPFTDGERAGRLGTMAEQRAGDVDVVR